MDDVEQLRREVRSQLNGKADDKRIISKNPSVNDLLEGTNRVFMIPGKGLHLVARHENHLYI